MFVHVCIRASGYSSFSNKLYHIFKDGHFHHRPFVWTLRAFWNIRNQDTACKLFQSRMANFLKPCSIRSQLPSYKILTTLELGMIMLVHDFGGGLQVICLFLRNRIHVIRNVQFHCKSFVRTLLAWNVGNCGIACTPFQLRMTNNQKPQQAFYDETEKNPCQDEKNHNFFLSVVAGRPVICLSPINRTHILKDGHWK